MTTNAEDIRSQLRLMRIDLTNLQGRVTNILNMLNELNLPEPDETCCPICNVHLGGPLSLAEHLYTSHDGPLPDHYAAAEKAAGLA
jgi:hypothetical protein